MGTLHVSGARLLAAAVAAVLTGLSAAFLRGAESRALIQTDREKAAMLRSRGLDLGYNHDYTEAFAAFRDAVRRRSCVEAGPGR